MRTGGEHGGYYMPVVELQLDGRKVRAPVWIMPGHADRSVTVCLGHGPYAEGLACAVGAWFSPAEFFRAYLAAYLFHLGIALGSMVLLLVYHLTGGSWGFLIRRILEAGVRTLPLLALFFLPIAFGIRYLYPWRNPTWWPPAQKLRYQQFYLCPTCFRVRDGHRRQVDKPPLVSCWDRNSAPGIGIVIGLAGRLSA